MANKNKNNNPRRSKELASHIENNIEEHGPTNDDTIKLSGIAKAILTPLASLKLTVVLLAMSIFLVLAGTVAQADDGSSITAIVKHFFRAPFAWVDFQIFFYRSFRVPGGFWFPGGLLLGAALAVNLLAAHLIRFKPQAKGGELLSGIILTALGCIATAYVILSGNDKGFDGQLSSELSDTVWDGFRFSLAALWLGFTAALFFLEVKRKSAWWVLLGLSQLLGLAAVWLMFDDSIKLERANMRILWQLIKATVAGLVLYTGCWVIFRKRGGVVLLHAGVALMMLGELLVGKYMDEGIITLSEGQTTNYVTDARYDEIAVVDRTTKDSTEKLSVAVIPHELLFTNAKKGDDGKLEREPIVLPDIPFTVRILDIALNTNLESRESLKAKQVAQKKKDNREDRMEIQVIANRGAGRTLGYTRVPAKSGTDMSDKSDAAGAYVQLFDKDNQSLGVYLLHVNLDEQFVHIGEKTYGIALQRKRKYRPYRLKLLETHADEYTGTETPKNYSSTIQITDTSSGSDKKSKVLKRTIWMNNPFRYNATKEAFYQSGYQRDKNTGREYSSFQVMSNTSWMIPYVACMLVSVGMFFHFGAVLVRFLKRQKENIQQPSYSEGKWPLVIPTLLVLVCGAYTLRKAKMPTAAEGVIDLQAAAAIPVAFEGRIKPLDTVARNSLRLISDKETIEIEKESKDGKKKKVKIPAIQWLMELASADAIAYDRKIFRITHQQVQASLGLKQRPGFRYSMNEVREGSGSDSLRVSERFILEISKVNQKRRENGNREIKKPLTQEDKAYLQTSRRLKRFQMLEESFIIPGPFQNKAEGMRYFDRMTLLDKYGVHALPPSDPRSSWRLYTATLVTSILNEHREPTAIAFTNIFLAYHNKDSKAFSKAISEYNAILNNFQQKEQTYLAALKKAGEAAKAKDSTDGPAKGPAYSEQLDIERLSFESFFNHFAPFFLAKFFYLVSFVLVCMGWLGFSKTFHRAALWLILFTFVIHTFGLAARIYISGRPPVTNLYSSAVFVGWACVLLGIVFEYIYGMGIGSLIAAVTGFITLLVSYFLGLDGDTIKVMQAVLDTNFWLATHVVCISLGYAATYVTGLLGLVYILRGTLTSSLDKVSGRVLFRMTYGTLCFALFFSFFGTVLGGLWGDDSWGRFWGWDTKENGALVIVLWNALVLHARWGKMVGERGFALLAIFGNIVTSWSWFGVNAIGVGLHSYGFDPSTVFWLQVFVISQLAIIALGLLIPKTYWRSSSDGA